jgi:hypothetical protein
MRLPFLHAARNRENIAPALIFQIAQPHADSVPAAPVRGGLATGLDDGGMQGA